MTIARDADLDLVEVAAQANPPVCRIMDYGKYKYEAAQKAKESRRKTSSVSIKEMKYRPKISKGDFDTKTRKVEKFLEEGHKVKVTLTFRGREMNHPELGQRILDQVVDSVSEIGRVEIFPRRDGRNMTMVLAPDRKAQAASERARRQAAEAASGEQPAAATTPTTPSTPDANGDQAPARPAAQAPAAPANGGSPAPAGAASPGRPQPSRPPQGGRPAQPGPATRPAERT